MLFNSLASSCLLATTMAQALQSQVPLRLIQAQNSEQQSAIQSLVQELERLSPEMFSNANGNERWALELPFVQPPLPATSAQTVSAAEFSSMVPPPLPAPAASPTPAPTPQTDMSPVPQMSSILQASPTVQVFSAMPMSQQVVSIVTTLTSPAGSDPLSTASAAVSSTGSLRMVFTAASVPTDSSDSSAPRSHRSRGTQLPFGLWMGSSTMSTGRSSAEESALANSSDSSDEEQELPGLASDSSSDSYDVWSAEYSRLSSSAALTSLSLAGMLLLPLLVITVI